MNLGKLYQLPATVWREARHLIVVLWLCRISTLSAALALALAFLPQIQDLYTEITYYQHPGARDYYNSFLFWLVFYALAFLWAFTVHYCARTVLSFEAWPLSQKDAPAYGYWIEAVPRYLGWVCILAIFIGQTNALHNLQIDDDQITRSTSSNYVLPLGLIFTLIIILQTMRRKLGKSSLTISALAILYWLYTAIEIHNQPQLSPAYRAQIMHNLALPVITIFWGMLFYLFVAERRRLLTFLVWALPAPHRLMLHTTRRLSDFFPIQIRPRIRHHSQAGTGKNQPGFLPFKKRGTFQFEGPSENVRGLMLGLFCLTFIMMLWLAFAISEPGTPPFELKRALLLPVLLGLWVPLLTLISFVSNQIRFPLLTSFIICGIAISWVMGDNHDLQITAPQEIASGEKTQKPPEKLALKKALELWMTHHNCEQNPRRCPPPLIIAAAGGASRSAFYVATVLGELHDKPELFWPTNLPEAARPKSPAQVRDHIFAISSVSGGSLGSAAYAALWRQQQKSLYPAGPCQPLNLRADRLLFSIPADKAGKLEFPVSWKNCLQAIAAGDFLSPTMVAYAFRDNLAISSLIGLITGGDRAKALERAWTRREVQLTGRSQLNDPLLTFQPDTRNWMPLLLFNATSVATGKRVIAAPLEPTYDPVKKIDFAPYLADEPVASLGRKPKTGSPLFPDSLDLHSLLNWREPDTAGWQAKNKMQLNDISLASAVSLSARFPLISPHANIRTPGGRVIDRLVDGGYFDNSGMLTALELSRAIQTITNNAIKPVLIQISNHPVSIKLQGSDLTGKPPRFRCPEQSFINQTDSQKNKQLLPELTAVTSAMLNARVARGSHAIALAHQQAGNRFIHFQVAGIRDELGASKKLSMSWWLSKSVQNALNNQINWARPVSGNNPEPLPARLNPAFCAIKKFRRIQRQHWQAIKRPVENNLGLNR